MPTTFPLNDTPASTGTADRLSFGFEDGDKLSVLVAGSETIEGTPINTRLRANVRTDQFPEALRQTCEELGISISVAELRDLLLSLAKHGSRIVRSADQEAHAEKE